VAGILSDFSIASAVKAGDIRIDPWNDAQLNPTSYDLTLGDQVRVYKRWVAYDEYRSVPAGPGGLAAAAESARGPRDGSDFIANNSFVLDVKGEPETVAFKIDPEKGWVLKPGIGYLMHTRERIWTKKFVPIVDGKSSIGRLFLLIHFTAGYGDPNFDGQYTLEVSALHPVKVYPGMRIGQIRFHTIEGELAKPYNGNYVGDSAQGAVASRAWKQFSTRSEP
jgi:dCTP deaminase